MVLKAKCVVFTCIAAALIVPSLLGQQKSANNATSNSAAFKQRQGFLDYTLRRINPNDRDYGECISEGRRILLSETVENGYFWSNVVSLNLLGCCFIFIIHRGRVQQQNELMDAEAFAQLHNALHRAEAQVEDATKRNQQLIESLAAASEAVSRTPQLRNDIVEPAPKKESAGGTQSASALTPVAIKGAAKVSTIAVGTPPTKEAKPAPQLGLFSPDVEQIAQVNALQQQLIRCQERVKNLSRQLNDAERRLQEEQQKNRSLRGE
jgi:hypothetical protein